MDMRCTGFSGADLGNLMQAAAQACLERAYLHQTQSQKDGAMEGVEMDPVLTLDDWEVALKEVKPSVKDPHMYEDIR